MKTLLFITFLLFGSSVFSQHHHESQHDPVVLNDGARWKANPETTEGIKSMQKHMQSFHTGEAPNVTDLHTNLQADFRGIFANCTMKGAAHDQLHNYLLPLRDLLSELESCDDCGHVMQHIDHHLADYPKYFE